MTAKSRTLLALIIATMAGMSLWFMTAAVLPDMAEEAGADETKLAWLSSAVQAGFVGGSLLFAFIGIPDRIDPRRVFAFCAVGTAVTNVMLLVVPIGGWSAIILRFTTGALMAGVWPIAMKIAFGWGIRDRGLLIGTLAGALTVGKSVPYLLAFMGGADWRIALVTGSLVASAGGGLVMFADLGPHHARATSFRARAIVLVWTNRKIRAAIIGYLGHMWELFVLWAWVGSAATASFVASMSAENAVSLGKIAAFLCVLAGAPACVWGGFLADRFGKARVAATALLISGTAAIATALTFGGSVWITLVLIVIWGAAVIPDSPQFSAIVADNAPPELAGSLVTFQAALGFLLTVFTVQLAPWVAATWSWPVLLAGLAIGPVVGLVGMRPVFR
jgi:MFS family permease